jgi:ectoine hydroxylase-related dioxygenase (phytanoyl-CoA dioxygenase family)
LFGEIDDIAEVPVDVATRFREDGYVVVRKLLTRELVETIRRRCDDAAAGAAWEPSASDPYRRAFRYVMNARLADPVLSRVAQGKRLAQLAARILDVVGVRLSHDQVLYKPEGGASTPIHADQFHWPVSTDATITAWIPLQDTSADAGSLQFYRGSHRLDAENRTWICNEKDSVAVQAYLASRFPLDVIEYTGGDVSFHRGWTFHLALANNSPMVRRAYSVVFMQDDITIVTPRPGVRLEHLRAWYPEARVGDMLHDAHHPVVFRF